jgi:uncharacterized membrane protein
MTSPTYSPILVIHIAGGLVAVLTGSTALLARKGGRLHRRSGDAFVISMLIMAAGGAIAAVVKSQTFNIFAGVFAFYLVATAFLTVRRKEDEAGRTEFVFLLVALAAAITALSIGANRIASKDGGAAGYFVFATIALLCSAGDVRMLLRHGLSGAQRMLRHVWRMCFALFVAAGSFFLGTASDPVFQRAGLRARLFTAEIRRTHLPQVPVLIIVILTIFWICRVKFTDAYKKPRRPGNREAVIDRQQRLTGAIHR